MRVGAAVAMLAVVPPATPASSGMRAALVVDAWVRSIRAGVVVVETRVLVFRDDGRVEVALLDDTGRHEAVGAWSLRVTDADAELRLDGELMGEQGTFDAAYDAAFDALVLSDRRGGSSISYAHAKGYRRSA